MAKGKYHNFSHLSLSKKHTPSILAIPNELIFMFSDYLNTHDLYHLISTHRRFYNLLIPQLHSLATRAENAQPALHWAVLSGNSARAKYILEESEEEIIVSTKRDYFWAKYGPNHAPDNAGRMLHRAPGKCDDETIQQIMQQQQMLSLQMGPKRCVDGTPLKWAIENGHRPLFRLALVKNRKTSRALCATAVLLAAFSEQRLANGTGCGDSRNKISIEEVLEWVGRALRGPKYQEVLDQALVRCVRGNLPSAVRILMAKGANLRLRDSDENLTVLGTIKPDMLDVLVESGARITMRDSEILVGQIPTGRVSEWEEKEKRELEEKKKMRELKKKDAWGKGKLRKLLARMKKD